MRSWRAFSSISTRKDAPLRFIDTHAGAGRYDLGSEAARRSPEWRDGVARLVKARPPGQVAALLRALPRRHRPIRRRGPAAVLSRFAGAGPGAAAAAGPHRVLRGASGGAQALVAALGRDGRLSIVGTDGYVALNAYVPPKERRGSR